MFTNSPSSPSTTEATTSGAHQPTHPFPVLNVIVPSDCEDDSKSDAVIDNSDQDSLIDLPNPTNRCAQFSCY